VPQPIVVQLLGPYHSKRPADLPAGYERYQLDEAKHAGIPTLHWRPDSLELAQVTDPAHAELLASAVSMSPERLKHEIIRRCEPPKQEPPFKKSDRRLVFVNSDRSDLALASEIRAELERHNFGVVLPDFDEGDYDDPDTYIRVCEALVLVFGEVSPKWVRRQLLRYIKLRHEREKDAVLEIFEGPPVPKADTGISLPTPTAWPRSRI